MARKSADATSVPASRGTAKRAASDTPNRQSKRARATSRKSYVEPGTDTDGENDASDSAGASDYEAQDVKDASSSSDHDEPDSEDSSSAQQGRKTKKSGTIQKKNAKEDALWKQGAKLEPGTQLIIKKPKARDAGDTPYVDDRIHGNTMLFLGELAANNNRPWLKLHDPDFRTSFQDFTSFTEKLSEKITEIDDTIPELPVKDVIYRIYRDIRFSKDPTPYKTYFSASWSRTGRKGPYAGYYVQIQPRGGSFVGGGLWQPDAAQLVALRREIDRRPQRLKRVLAHQDVREAFLGGVDEEEESVVKAFVGQRNNAATALKRNPKGYDIDHRDIALLRLRSFTLGTKLADDEVVGAGGLERICGVIRSIEPFITYLNSVVMPDSESSGTSDEGDDDDQSEPEAESAGD